jgi:hypothetical protein
MYWFKRAGPARKQIPMNEQIQELMAQAGTDSSGKWMGVEHAEKFAKLIVCECAEIADQEIPNSIGCGYITQTKGMMIKQHFGVEE